eukprot:2272837-Prymnesium_polylepis.1
MVTRPSARSLEAARKMLAFAQAQVGPQPHPTHALELHARAVNRTRRAFLQPSLPPTAPERASPQPQQLREPCAPPRTAPL